MYQPMIREAREMVTNRVAGFFFLLRKTRRFYFDKISSALGKSVEGFIEAGRWLIEAKEEGQAAARRVREHGA